MKLFTYRGKRVHAFIEILRNHMVYMVVSFFIGFRLLCLSSF